MPRSMTGYGRGSCTGPTFSITAELRSVNHRYTDFFLRVPQEFYPFEDRIRRLLQKEIGRGRVEVNIVLHGSPSGEEEPAVNEQLAAAYYRVLESLAERLDLPLEIGVGNLMQLPGVLELPESTPAGESLWPFLEKALQEALERLVEQRIAEGRNLSRDLAARLADLEVLVKELAALTPVVLKEQKLRLESRLQEMLVDSFDESRLLVECAVLVEKMDIHEELVRLRSHLKAFGGALQLNEGPIGRRLDFIAQEIFREINTVGAKAQDYQLAALVVEIKTELEKMREQIQNIE
ncbi:MAG: YicC/YloC family endoribonuclease [Bacillota bacterium]|nr:YicC/YloC family endoribonuclease [Bacillota bacterium]